MAVEIGAILEGKVTGITNFGAFVELPDKTTGMVHISEVSSSFIKDIHEKLSEGDVVKVKVIDINEKGKVALSIKKAQPEQQEESKPKRPAGDRPKRGQPPVWTGTQRSEPETMSFEDMMAKFKQVSDDKFSDLRRSNDSRYSQTSRRGNRK